MSKKKSPDKKRTSVREVPIAQGDAPAAPALSVGDHVRVRPDVRDPDFKNCEIGGWTGRVTGVGKDRGPKTSVTVTWDRRTRLAIPIAIRKRCSDEGLGFNEV